MRSGLRREAGAEAREIALHLGRHFNPRLLLALLAGCALGMLALDFLQSHGFGYSLQLFDLTDSDIRSELSLSATATSVLLFAAAWLCFALEGVDPKRAQARWNIAAAVFLLYAVQELFGFEHWLETVWDLGPGVYILLVTITALAWAGAFHTLRTRPRLQICFGAATLCWLGALVVNGFQQAGSADPALAELAEFVGAGLFCIALLGRLQHVARRADPLEQITAPHVSRAAAQLVARIDLERLVIVLAALIVGFAIQDVIFHVGNYHGHQMPVLDVNTEQTIPATFSALILVAAGGLAILISRMFATPRGDRPWWRWFGFVLLALALEEVAAVHDTFQDLTGMPGQVILLPLAIVGVMVWWQLVERTKDRPGVRSLLIAGAAVWLVSQTSDVLLNPIQRWAIVPEEALEMVGSSLWLVATAVLVRRLLAEGDEILRARDTAATRELRFAGDGLDLNRSAQTDSAL